MSKYDNVLKERVKRRVRPFQYLMLHIFAMVTTLILMGVSTEYNLVSEDAILVVSILFVISLIAHVFWRANEYIWQKIEWEEENKLLDIEKPKHDYSRLDADGELINYDEYEYQEKQLEERRISEIS